MPVQLPAVPVEVVQPPPAPQAPPSEAPQAPTAPTETQYQAPETQYHTPSADPAPVAADAAAAAAPAAQPETADAPVEADAAPVEGAAPASDTAASDIGATNSDASALPSTWIWNWNWNCDPSAPSGQESVVANGTWVWNWDFNCAAPNATADSGQYQSAATQYQPSNTNISIRIASPGDNGPVTQVIAAVAQATASAVNEVTQAVSQTGGPTVPPPVATPTPPVDPATTIATELASAVSGMVATVLPLSAPLLPSLTVPLPPLTGGGLPLPAIGVLTGLGFPEVAIVVPNFGNVLPIAKPKPTKTRSPSAPAALAAGRDRRRGCERVGCVVGPGAERGATRLHGAAAHAFTCAGAAAPHARGLLARRRRRWSGRRSRRGGAGGPRSFLPFGPALRSVAHPDAESPSTAPADGATARTPGLARRLWQCAGQPRPACPSRR